MYSLPTKLAPQKASATKHAENKAAPSKANLNTPPPSSQTCKNHKPDLAKPHNAEVIEERKQDADTAPPATVTNKSQEEVRLADVQNDSQQRPSDVTADQSMALTMDTALLPKLKADTAMPESEVADASGIPLPADTSSDLSLHGGRSCHSSQIDNMSVSSGSPPPQGHVTPPPQGRSSKKVRGMITV